MGLKLPVIGGFDFWVKMKNFRRAGVRSVMFYFTGMKRVPFLGLVLSSQAYCAIVEINYLIVPGSVAGDPLTIPNPSGEDFEVTPSAEITSGIMTVRFAADGNGVISDGSAVVTDLDFTGNTNLRVTTGQQLFGQDVFVDITGPLTGDQQSWSFGSLDGLSSYSESTTGSFDTVFGPIGCSGNFFNAGCAALTLLVGIEFPLAEVAADEVTLSLLNGTFTDLNSPGSSAASNSFDIPIQAAGGIGAPLPVNFTWTEMDRSILPVPEPGTTTLALIGILGFALRKKR